MKSLIALRNLSVENANAVSGLTWGFPSVSHFLGFCHALDRKLRAGTGLQSVLGGCAIICHSHQTQSYSDDFGQHSFALTRNPLTKEAKTMPFNEEGRMHMEVSLLIECKLSAEEYLDALDDDSLDESELSDEQLFEQVIENTVLRQRLAGGSIRSLGSVSVIDMPNAEEGEKVCRRQLAKCLPGFALVDRSELLTQQLQIMQQRNPSANTLDAWLEFAALRYRASSADPEAAAEWARVELPESAWLVPLLVGYQGIADLQPPGAVVSARDASVPFAAVEAVYGVGQWLNPLRAPSLESLLWCYDYQDSQQYRLHNPYFSFIQDTKGA